MLRLNLSDQEANSKAREFSVLPTGAYNCNIVEIKSEQVSPTSKNAGKPYWNMKLIVDQEGSQYNGKPIYTNIMLFEGALYLAKQLVEVLFPDMIAIVDGNTQMSIPGPDAFYGKRVQVVGVKYAAGSKIKNTQRTRENDQFEVKGFKSVNEPTRSGGNTSLLS